MKKIILALLLFWSLVMIDKVKAKKSFNIPHGISLEKLQALYEKGKIPKGVRNKLIRNRIFQKKQKIEEADKKLQASIEIAKDQDPFYFFEPNVGVLSDEQKTFLGEYLKPEDIPDRVDGQLDALLCTSPEIGIAGGNQSSKTTTTCIRVFIQATGEIPFSLQDVFPQELLPKKFPQRWRVCGVSDATLSSTIFPTYKKWVPRSYLKNGSWADSFSSKQSTLFLYRGGEEIGSIEFKTYRQDVETYQGPPLDGIAYDEEPTSAIYEENILRFVTADRINIFFGFTPTGGLTWLADHFADTGNEAHAEKSLFLLCTATNKAANLDVVRQICDRVKEDYKILKMRLLGEFISLSGLVYGRVFDRKIHVIPPFFDNLPPEKKKEYFCVSGWDSHSVSPTAGVFILVDREGICYVDRCYYKQADTEEIKADFHRTVKECGYRMGWSRIDPSTDSNAVVFSGRNIFKELSRGKNAIPALGKSDKFKGSKFAGVDIIKKRLRAAAIVKGYREGKMEEKPLYVVDRPENKLLIKSFSTLERDTYADEDKKGEKDDIREGKHHLHAALRYANQRRINWIASVVEVPEYEPDNEWTNY